MKKLLIIANKEVYPALDGGSLAIQNLTQKFIKLNYKIDLVAITKKNDSLDKKIYKSTINNNINQIVFHKNMSLNLKALMNSLLCNNSYQANRFYSRYIKDYIQMLIDKNDYEIIIFESIFTTVFLNKIKIKSSVKIILRAHNLEHEIWENLSEKNFFKKIIYFVLALQIKKMEKTIPEDVDYIFTISNEDFRFFKKLFPKKTHNIPVTFNVKKSEKQKIKNSIVHLGAMDWKPNLEGMSWFLKSVFPKILNSKHIINVYIAGKKMPAKFLKKQLKNTKIESKIANAESYISNKEVLFVPLFSGSGIRIKILEGMALGIPVITTTKGAQGIPCSNGKNILIADNADDFFDSIELLINDKNYAKKIGVNGQKIIQEHFSEMTVVNKIKEIVK